jgi:ADP-ribose pyrophosphatase YjhB (NUDIX family)
VPDAHAHCGACGARFPPEAPWPRTCAACGHTTHRNPLPVAVLLVPVELDGVLLVRRAIAPVGLALPGGFIELGESWQEAAVREAREEAGIGVDPATVRELRVLSAPDGTLLVFGLAPPVPAAALDAFAPSAEVSGLVVADGPRDDLVFPLHAQVLAERYGGTG